MVRMPVSRVTTINEPLLLLILSRDSTILFKAPEVESTPAKDRARNAIRRVLIMLSMPPRFNRLMMSLAAGPKLKPLVSIEVTNPLTRALNALVTEKCWMTTALNMAATDESSITGMVGFFHADPIRMIRRGMSSMTTFQVKACESALFISATLSKPRPPMDWTQRPATNMTIADTNREGTWSTTGASYV